MKKAKEALKHIQKIRQLMSKVKSPYAGMNEQQIIDEIRKTREKLFLSHHSDLPFRILTAEKSLNLIQRPHR